MMQISRGTRRRGRLLGLAVGAIPLSLCTGASAGQYWNDTNSFTWINSSNWNAGAAVGNSLAGPSLRAASPTLAMASLSPNANSASNLILDVNPGTGDVYLQANAATAFTGYDIFDKSGNLLDSGDANTDLNELLLSRPTSNRGNTTTYRNATNYKLWATILDNATTLAEASNNGKLKQGTASTYDTINIPSGGTIDFGHIYNEKANNQDLSFYFSEADPTNGGNPVTGTTYTGQVEYGFDELGASLYWKNSATTGDWSNANNWSSISASGADNSGPPGGNFQQIYIDNSDALNHVITVESSATVANLFIGNTGGGSDTLLVTGTLPVGGAEFGEGTIGVNSGGNLNISGGTVGAKQVMVGSGGTLSMSGGTLSGAIAIYGMFAPANATSTINGTLTLESSATTLAQRTGSATSFGTVECDGNLALAGVLAVYTDAANEAEMTSSQSFIILQTTGSTVLTGAFANIASGQTITTTDGTASFLVTINQGSNGDVVLSDFQAVPEPGTLGLLGFGGTMMMGRRRKRQMTSLSRRNLSAQLKPRI